jgi:predicted nuclease of predicted toxin-antitoxin system
LKVLLDTCVWGPARFEIKAAGHEVEWTGLWSEDPGDHEILERARGEGRVIVTLDKDFGELAVVRGLPHCGIVRLVGFGARQQGGVCVRVLKQYGRELEAGALVTVAPGRVRIRPAD